MSETPNHPTMERLQAFVEASLDAADGAVVDSHLASCARCRTEVEELRTLFGALGSVARFAPTAGFADRVMTRVRVRRPAFAGASEWLERLTPQTTRGWAAAAALVALPVVGTTLVVWWLMSQPGVSPQGLWLVTSSLLSDAAATAWQWGSARVAASSVAVWVARSLELVGEVGRGEIGLAAVMFATMTAASVYVLYQNLFRTNARRTEHASYVF